MRHKFTLRPWALPVLVVLALALPAGVGPSSADSASFVVRVPVFLGSAAAQSLPVDVTGDSTGDVTDGAAELLRVSPLVLEAAGPGETTPWATVRVENLGASALRVSLAAGALAGPDGAVIPASALEVRGGGAEATVAPGEAFAFEVRLHVPEPWEAYAPAGDYEGVLTLTAEVGA